jgi:hypothetical protein
MATKNTKKGEVLGTVKKASMMTRMKTRQSRRDPVSLYFSYHSFKKEFRTKTFLVIIITKKSIHTTAVAIASRFIIFGQPFLLQFLGCSL